MHEQKLFERITVDPRIFDGKPIIRGRRLVGRESVEPLFVTSG